MHVWFKIKFKWVNYVFIIVYSKQHAHSINLYTEWISRIDNIPNA